MRLTDCCFPGGCQRVMAVNEVDTIQYCTSIAIFSGETPPKGRISNKPQYVSLPSILSQGPESRLLVVVDLVHSRQDSQVINVHPVPYSIECLNNDPHIGTVSIKTKIFSIKLHILKASSFLSISLNRILLSQKRKFEQLPN